MIRQVMPRLQLLAGRIERDGVGQALRLASRRVASEVRAFVEDARRGVSTRGEVPDEELGFQDPQNHAYVATDYDMFRTAFATVEIRAGEDVFVDVGSGKGRAVLLAAEHPFRRVIGVEISPALHAIAEENLRASRGRRCQDVELVLADATEWEVPPDATVLFFFNPFHGEVLRKVCDNIRRSLAEAPRRITVIYVRPDKFFEREIDWTSWLVREHEFPYSDGKVAIYRSR